MEPSFELPESFRRALEESDRRRAEEDARRGGGPGAAEALANNVEVPFSMRMGAQERKLLLGHARLAGKSMSQLARELLVDGLMRMEAARRRETGDDPDQASLVEQLRLLRMLAQAAEDTAERAAARRDERDRA